MPGRGRWRASVFKAASSDLVRPYSKDIEPRPVYIARMISDCHSKLRDALPTLPRLHPALAPAGCGIAGVEAKANPVLMDIEACKAD